MLFAANSKRVKYVSLGKTICLVLAPSSTLLASSKLSALTAAIIYWLNNLALSNPASFSALLLNNSLNRMIHEELVKVLISDKGMHAIDLRPELAHDEGRLNEEVTIRASYY